MPARPKRASASTRAVAHIGPWSILVTQCEMAGNSQLRARSPRDRLLDAIRIEPGLSTNGLHKKVGDAWGTLAEALITLQKDGEVHIRQEPFCGRIVKRLLPRCSRMTTMNQDRPHTRGHAFDDAGTCQHCGFDAAEWRWWRFNTTKGQKSQAMMPECEATNSTTESKR